MRLILLFIIAFPSIGYAEYIEEWSIEMKSTKSCLPETDVCDSVVTLIDKKGNETKITGLTGETYAQPAIKNKQILACEYNVIMKTKGAKIFDLKGKLIKVIPHKGFLRECKITKNGKLYWFQYNLMKNSKFYNYILVVSKEGKTVLEQPLNHGGEFKFNYNNDNYVIILSEPQWPG